MAAPAGVAPAAGKKKKRGNFADLTDYILNRTEPVAADEVTLWMSARSADTTTDPLVWWSTRGAVHFPSLALQARKYLCIPATSIPSERVFSAIGHVLSKRRMRLLPAHAEALVFLRENIDILHSTPIVTLMHS